MFIKNLLRPGEYVVPVPAGLPATLQYDRNGQLSRIFSRYESDKKIHNDLMTAIQYVDSVPQMIPTKGGDTYVSGVFYSDKMFSKCESGKYPECLESSYIKAISEDPSDFTFYAGNVTSLAAVFAGANTVMNWLKLASFKSLEGFIVPLNLSNDSFILDSGRWNFHSIISCFFIYSVSGMRIQSTESVKVKVNNVIKYVDEVGNIKAHLEFDIPDYSTDVDYSEIYHFNIHKNSMLSLTNSEITYSEYSGKPIIEPEIVCSYCGRPINISRRGLVFCEDIHCKSKWFTRINRMLDVFRLPTMSKERFDNVVKDMSSIVDVFSLPEYSSLTVETNLTTVLDAMLPINVSDHKISNIIVSKCKNQIDSLMYYIKNPQILRSEIESNSRNLMLIIHWLSDPANQLDIESLLYCPNIKIDKRVRMFDGAPIFRNKTICITGNFLRGYAQDIEDILRSYSANVITSDTFTCIDDIDCVVTGDTLENIDGKIIYAARQSNRPIFTESDFFKMYEIDEDISANLQ